MPLVGPAQNMQGWFPPKHKCKSTWNHDARIQQGKETDFTHKKWSNTTQYVSYFEVSRYHHLKCSLRNFLICTSRDHSSEISSTMQWPMHRPDYSLDGHDVKRITQQCSTFDKKKAKGWMSYLLTSHSDCKISTIQFSLPLRPIVSIIGSLNWRHKW